MIKYNEHLLYLDSVTRPRMKECLSQSYLLNDSLSFNKYESVVLHPNGLIEKSTGAKVTNGSNYIYIGHMLPIWGHCISDNLKKLWFIKTEECQQLLLDGYKLCITLERGGKLPNNFVKLLYYLNIDSNRLEIIDDDIHALSIIVPDDSIVVKGDYRYYYKDYKDIIDQICCQLVNNDSLPKKIYLSRTKLNGSKAEYGEKDIEDVFSKLGYTIIYPEELSFEEQLAMYWNCDVMASTEGSIAHNCLFAKDGVKQIIIRKSLLFNSYQFVMMDMKNVNVTYIDAHLTLWVVFATWNGPFFMCLNDNLTKWFREQGLAVNATFSIARYIQYAFTCFWQFLRYRLKPRMIPQPYKHFYLTKLKRFL